MRPAKSLIAISFLALTLGAALGSPSIASAQSTRELVQDEASTLRQSRTDWPQASSDVAPDPAVRFGTLPNGMRYALMHNATPPGQASLRIRIDVGSFMEEPDQRGLAHFIEHMAFNGTRNIPEGDLLPILERLGLAFGPDTNAFTSFDQTVYQLDLPNTADETVDTGLMIMRDMVGDMTLAAESIDRERGIVLSEERTRASPGLRMAEANFDFLAEGQLAGDRFPIGETEVLRNAPQERFQAFYNAYYRPERATLVAVGDFDLDAMEAKIRAEFSDWTNAAPNGPEPDLGPVLARTPEAFVFTEAGAPPQLEIAWVAPADRTPDSEAARREDIVEQLGFAILNRRLGRLARGDSPPFVSGSASRSTLVDSQDQVSFTASYQGEGWRQSLAALEQERRRILEHGFTADELAREITEWRAAYEAYVAGAATRRTPALADAITGTVHEQEVFTAPASDLASFNAAVEGLTPDTVMSALRTALEGDGPLVFLSSPTAVEGGADAVMAVLAESQATPVEVGAAQVSAEWPYADFGAPGTVTERATIEDLGVTTVVLSNGVRLTLKPTDFRDDQVLISVNMGTGRLGLPNDRLTPMWGASSALIEGGLGRMSREDIEAVLASRVVSSSFGLGDDAMTLSGSTRPADLDIEMQLLAAYASDPAYRPQAFERIRAAYAAALPQFDASPAGVFGREAGALLRGGDLRWALPDAAGLAAAQASEIEALTRPVLASAPMEVIIVGDFDLETAIQSAAATFGALPARAAEDGEINDAVRFPAGGETVRLTHSGRDDQGLAFLGWSTTDARSNVREARVLTLLSAVMRLRLIEEIREGQAVTYSPSSGSSTSWAIPGYGYLSASIEAPPERLDAFFADAETIAASLRDTPVEADELDRARRPLVEQYTRSRVTNEFWQGQLADLQTDETRLPALRSQIEDMQTITAEELQAAARAYLTPERAYRIVVTPAAPAE